MQRMWKQSPKQSVYNIGLYIKIPLPKITRNYRGGGRLPSASPWIRHCLKCFVKNLRQNLTNYNNKTNRLEQR